MAVPRKKRAVEEDMETNMEEVDSSDDEEELDKDKGDSTETGEDQQVQIDFEARNFDDSDFHGIKKLLQQLFLKANINLSEMTDTLISQNYIGSAIKQMELDEMDVDEDDDSDDAMDVFGIVSVLNITERKDLDCVKQLKGTLLNHCVKYAPDHKGDLMAILERAERQVGFLISERFINIPPQIAVPSFESLWKEVDRACKKRMKYKFDTYMMISKTCKLPQIAEARVGKASGKKKGKAQGALPDVTVFINPEEEIFQQHASWSFEYSVKSEHDFVVGGQWDDEEDEMEPFRTVMFIPSENIPEIMSKMKELYCMPNP